MNHGEEAKQVQSILNGNGKPSDFKGEVPRMEYTIPPKKFKLPRIKTECFFDKFAVSENPLMITNKYATANGNSRYPLEGVHIDVKKNGKKIAVASDTHVLLHLPYDGDVEPGTWIIGEDGKPESKVEGAFPRYTSVIPKTATATIKITDDMAQTIHAGTRAAKIGDGGVLFRFSSDDIVVYAPADQMASMMTALREAGYTPRVFDLSTDLGPLVIKTNDANAFALIMSVDCKETPAHITVVRSQPM